MFIETETFIGPDRRFRKSGPPAEFGTGRRREDIEAAEAAETPEDSATEATSQETMA
jgi:hypothetical protein